MSNLHKKVNF